MEDIRRHHSLSWTCDLQLVVQLPDGRPIAGLAAEAPEVQRLADAAHRHMAALCAEVALLGVVQRQLQVVAQLQGHAHVARICCGAFECSMHQLVLDMASGMIAHQ